MSIVLNCISHAYDGQKVLEDFSYYFNDSGFYLLFGPSGCGKTTLLNILSGILSPNEGEYILKNKLISSDIDRNKIIEEIAYITQDCYFIEYLTMKENLDVISKDKAGIEILCKRFDLLEKIEQYPKQLSGGEKQRFRIVQALLTDKKILLLDEPTASLDIDNKRSVFQLLQSLKQEMLIICVSHDMCAKEYSDNIIEFENLKQYKNQILMNDELLCTADDKEDKPYETIKLFNFVKKQSRFSDKISHYFFILILIVTNLIVLFCISPEDKIIDMLANKYHYNYLSISIPKEEIDTTLNESNHIKSIVYPYNYGADYATIGIDDNILLSELPKSINTSAYLDSLLYETLPVSSIYYYHNHLAAGKYFTEKDEIMLSYDKAMELGTPSQLINEDLSLSTPHGKEKFKIAGVFLPFEKESLFYMEGGFESSIINHNVFFNNLYTEQFLYDDYLSNTEKTSKNTNVYMMVYFESFNDLWKFYEKYQGNDTAIKITPITNRFNEAITTFESAQIVLLPLAMFSLLLSLLFYMNSNMENIRRNMKNLSTYRYYGFGWKDVKRQHKKYLLYVLLKNIVISIVISWVCALLINICNNQFHFFVYRIFTLDILYLIVTSFVVFVLSIIFISYEFSTVKEAHWYDLLKVRRDLL